MKRGVRNFVPKQIEPTESNVCIGFESYSTLGGEGCAVPQARWAPEIPSTACCKMLIAQPSQIYLVTNANR